ncbi:hypothetical protein GCM10020366_58360 [Saccharopolyspora gregorii]|uniref:Uncharacterized protein n=1 Tax=Saccharopolyspora gregorii TaxID=33914 RepID=A0ABP6RZ95_9PSEU
MWPHGNEVQVYGATEYERRLTGELRESDPLRRIPVGRFPDYEAFREWCVADRRAREAACAPPVIPRRPGNWLSDDLKEP